MAIVRSTPLFDQVVEKTGIDPKAFPTDLPNVRYDRIPKRAKHRLAKDAEAVLVAAGLVPTATPVVPSGG